MSAANGAPGQGQSDAASQGPPVDMPAQVPEFVTQIHGAIGSHLDGGVPGVDLGEAVR